MLRAKNLHIINNLSIQNILLTYKNRFEDEYILINAESKEKDTIEELDDIKNTTNNENDTFIIVKTISDKVITIL